MNFKISQLDDDYPDFEDIEEPDQDFYEEDDASEIGDIIEQTVLTISEMFFKLYADDYGEDLKTKIRHIVQEAYDNADDEGRGEEFQNQTPLELLNSAEVNFFQNMRPFLYESILDVLRKINYMRVIDGAIEIARGKGRLSDQELKDIKYGVHNELPEKIAYTAAVPFAAILFRDPNPENLGEEFNDQIINLVSRIFKDMVTHRPETPRTVEELLAIPMNPEVADIRSFITGLNQKQVIAISIEDAKTQIKFMVPTMEKLVKEAPEQVPTDKTELINTLAQRYMQERGVDVKDLSQRNVATQIARIFVGQYGDKIADYLADIKQ